MRRFLLVLTALWIGLNLAAQNLPTKVEIISSLKKANDYWQTNNPVHGRAFWDNAAYHTGNMAAYAVTGIHRYLEYSEAWAEQNEWKGAKSDNKAEWLYSYGESDRYVLFGDWQICFQTYIDLFNLTEPKDSSMIARALEVMEYQMSTDNVDYWWWADGLYMVMPVMTKLYQVTGDELYLEKLYEYFKYAQSIMYDEETGLFYRDARYVYPDHASLNGLKDFWARGDGWVFAGLAKIIQDMPEDYAHKAEFEQIYLKMAVALKASQQSEGYWTRSILDPEHAPGPETSGTAFFTYGFAWGINHGLLSEEDYLPTVQIAWDYLSKTALQGDGRVGYVQPIGDRAVPGQIVDENSTANFGVGAFILAASEVVHLAPGEMPLPSLLYMESVEVINANQIRIVFNETIDETSGTNIANYSIDGITIQNISLSEDQKSSILTVSNLPIGKHQLVIQNILSKTGYQVETGETKQFAYYGVQSITASSYEPGSANFPECTLDLDLNTRWSAFGSGEWILYDLGEEKMVESLDIAFYRGDTRQSIFKIELSIDGENFNEVFTGESGGATLELENFDFEDQAARYVKIIGDGNSDNEWNSLTEVRINHQVLSTGINENMLNEVSVFPNPFQNGVLSIRNNFDAGASCIVQIHDNTGRILYDQEFDNVNYNELEVVGLNLPKGIYAVSLIFSSIKKSTFLFVQ